MLVDVTLEDRMDEVSSQGYAWGYIGSCVPVSYTHLVIGHHERYDGKGYPRRIAGEDIPLTARILCVADSFDAMTSKRCYKKAFPIEVAREKLLQDAGRQFDPDLVYKFVECLDNGSITLVRCV